MPCNPEGKYGLGWCDHVRRPSPISWERSSSRAVWPTRSANASRKALDFFTSSSYRAQERS
uniref:Uncharacterized protein n=1 Tax=Hyaloperonospora arabidopsidis (strain Emoy2) TaxID=559515 RepID=M4BJN2_HYAAE